MAIDWEEVRREYAPMVWSVVWRILAHDADALECSQEVFLEAIERSRGLPVDNCGGFLRWLATRRAIDMLRRRKRQPKLADMESLEAGRLESPTAAVEFEDLVRVVRAELASLPRPQAEAFWLVCVEERSYREVADLMAIQANAVGILVHRARQHLRRVLPDWKPERADHSTRHLT